MKCTTVQVATRVLYTFSEPILSGMCIDKQSVFIGLQFSQYLDCIFCAKKEAPIFGKEWSHMITVKVLSLYLSARNCDLPAEYIELFSKLGASIDVHFIVSLSFLEAI